MKNSILGKARWLRDVALATSKNNGARVAHEWLKYAAMFVMLFTIGVGNVWADYTIEFKSTTSSSDGSTARTSISDIISSGATYVSSIGSPSKVYNGKSGYGVKLGSGSATGYFTINFSTSGQVKPTKIIVNACRYGSDTGNLNYKINGGSQSSKTLTSSFADYEISMDGSTTITSLYLGSSSKRIYVKSVTIQVAASKTYYIWDGSEYQTSTESGTTISKNPTPLCSVGAAESYGWITEEYANTTAPSPRYWKNDTWPTGKTKLYAVYYYDAGEGNAYYSTHPTIYNVTYSTTHATLDEDYSYTCTTDILDLASATYGSFVYAYYTPASGYTLDETCFTFTYTSGGGTFTPSDMSYNSATGELWIDGVDGNITITATAKTCTILSTPTNFYANPDSVAGGNTYVRVTWKCASDITSHAQYLEFSYGLSGQSAIKTFNTLSKTATRFHQLRSNAEYFPSDGTYWVKIRALGDGATYCDGAYLEGSFTICTKDVSGVTPTVNAATSIGKYGATANWSAVTDADHYTVKVYRGSNASGTLEKTYSDVTGTSQVITGLSSANTTYYIEVQAHDACGHNSSKGGVTFTTLNLTLYTVTFVNAAGEAPAAVAQLSEGGTVSIPNAEACDGWEFAGWKIGSAQSSVTSDPTGSGYIKNATYPFNYTPGSNITAYAVFKKTEGGGGDTEVLAKSIGFESSEGFTASTTYNNESTPNTQGPTGEKWDFIMGTPSSNDALKNSQSAQMRSYSGKYTEGYVMMKYDISRVTKVKFLAKNNGTGALHCYYSTNSGSTWTGDQNMNINNTATYYTYTVSATGEYANVRIKFQNETTDAAGRVYIDSVYIYHMEAGGGTTTWKSDVSCNCPNYSFHSKNSSSVWDDPICFAQVGSSTLYRTEEIELPTDGVSFKVGWHDADDAENANTSEKDWQYMVAGPTTTRSGGGYWTVGGHLTSGNTGGAKGYFYVYSNSDQDNKYVGFTPSGYVLRWGKGESWTSKAFTAASASIDETEWNTEAVTLSSSNASDHIYVGLKTEGGYVWCNNSEEQRVIFLSPGVWDSEGCKFGLWDKTHLAWRGFMQDADGDGVYEGTVPSSCTEVTFARFDGAKTEPVWDQQYNKSADQTISSLTDKNMFSVTGWGSTYCEGNWNTVYNKPGVFRINAGSNLKNWSCKFVPHFVLTYDKNDVGASGTMDPTTVASDAASKNVSVAACGFTAPTGYHFDHWDTAPDGSGSDYDPNDTYNLTADVTLYAIWAKNTHTLTWEYDGGTPSGTYTAAGTVAYGTALTAPTMTKTGYTFNVWSPSVPATMPDDNVTYTATWNANTYQVRFNRNGGTGGADMANQNFTYDVAQNLNTCTFTKDGKSFGGWTTNSDGTGDEYANGASVSNLSSTQGAVVDLYAKWVDCTLYTVTLNVNGSTWKTVTQGSCGASIDLSDYADAPACNGGYTLRGWSTTNTATPMFDAPVITTTSTYTPTSDITLYAVYSHTAVIGTRITSTSSISEYEYYIVVASGYNKVMCVPTSTTNLAAATDVVKSADGSKCYVTGNGTPLEIMFSDKSTYWMISKYNSSTGNYWYYYSQGSRNALAWYDEDDYQEWWIDDYIEKYGDWYDAEDYVASTTPSSQWSISFDGNNAIISESTNSRTWKYNSNDVKFGAYTSGNKAISLYQYDEDGLIYTTQPDMTYYTITKGATTNGSISISKGVVCSGSVDVVATADPGYTFSGWSVTSGSGSFGSTSSASTTFTPSANATITATFVAATPHDITWMVNGSAYITGNPTGSLTAGTSFSSMTLPTAPADNTLSSACSAVADVFVGWSQTDMGFATGQSAPAKLFTDATGAGTAYGVMGGEDVTFYAVFAKNGSPKTNYMSRCPNTYTITLDDNGDYGGNGSATATEMSNTLTINTTPTRLGYSVEGYYKEVGTTTKVATYAGALQNGSGSGIADWTNSSSQFIGTSDGTLYTNWNIDTYNITYDNLNGASNSNPATYQVTTATIVLADPGSRTGYTFTGWTYGGNPITQIILGSTGDKTITANWNAEQYTITYKDQGDNAYSGDKTDGRPTGNPATHTYGSATDLVNGTRTGYRFDGWFTAPACTGNPITSIASDAVGPFTLYAKWTASHTYSFSKNGVIDGTLQLGAVEGETVTMPNTTVNCGLWTTFEGWVESDVAETTTEPATIYRAGDVYEVPLSSGDKTFKAVYSKHEGDATVSYVKETSGPRSGTYVIAGDNTHMYIFAGYNAENSTATYGKYATDHTFSISDANVITSKGGGVEVSIIKSTNGKFAIKSGSYCAKPSSADLNTKETDPAAALVWQMSESRIQEVDATTYYLEINNNNHQFKCYAGTQTKAYLYRKKVAGTTYYTTAPASCAIPTQVVVSYNDNKAHAGDQTITGMPSGTTLTFTEYPNFASYSIGAAPTDPTGYHFAGWNTSADGNGDDYAAGASVTTFGYVETVTLFAKWERVYSVTLYDNGVERTTLVEASAGAGVTLPSGNNCTPGSAFTFEGWTESAVELNADPVRPATLHAAGAFAPTSDITLYSVYSKSVAGCEDFAEGVSGAYKMYNNTSGDYAKVTANSNRYDKGSSGDAEIFYIAYAPAHSAYTIRTSLGYLGWSGAVGSETLTKNNATPYYWNITTNGTNWNFQPVGVSGKQFSGNGTYFNLHSNSTKYYIRLEKVAMKYYYNTAICEGAQITFHDGGGTISGTPTTPTGASWNSSTHVLSGLEDCDKITTFPTASYDGWTFIGWSTEDYSNSGKHTTDHAAENASTDEPDGSEIYKTGGNPYVVRGGSIDLYPIFTRFPENEPFNEETGGRYYIYYLKPGTDDGYGSQIRVYAGERDNDVRYKTTKNCASAVEFNFVKDGDIWHIIDTKNGNKYVAGVSGNDNLNLVDDLSGTCDDWTITIKSGNQFYASCQSGGRYISYSTSANYFMDYSTTANPGICLPVYLGTCTERIFSSEPEPTPTIDLEGEPYVTSSNGERVRATATMTLSAAHLSSLPANKVIVSGGTGLKFATTASANPDATVSLSLTDGNLAATTIYVYYTPSATEDGLENIIVTAKAYNGSSYKEFQKTGTVHARHLPADFVIAAKWNDKWYALPNTCTSSGSSTTGVLISVDNESDPTCATYAPTTAKWGMRETKKGSRSDGSYNDRLVFTERGTTATANSQQALYNYNSADIFTNATYTNYNNENPDRYEWIPVTSDFKDYTLTNANNASRTLILRNSDGEFKAQNTDQAYEGKVRLLPATFLDANVQIIEWKASSVVIMYTGTETTAKTKVGTNSASGSQTLSSKKIAHGIYELSVSPSLTGNAGNNLEISFGSDASKKLFEIPIIITGNSTTATGHDKQDVVIVKGAKLTAAGTKYSYRNIYVYGGGKLKIASGTSLGVNNIILRAGNISTDGSGGSATYEYIYPQVELGGTLTSTQTNIKYEYITDYDHWYQLCLPFNASLNSIHYPKEYYGNIVEEGNTGSWVIKRYAGEIRATGEYDAWKDIEKDSPKKTEVTAGNGYLFWGAPKKVTIGDDKQRQTWGIQRMTMSVTAAAATSAETDDKNITVDSYSEVATSTKPNDQGWNLVGNPYMVNLTDLSSMSIIAGKLVQEKDDKENWTGKWKNDGTNVRYVTVPDNHFDNYEAKTASVAADAGDFMPGRAFFVQIAEGATTLTFAASNRASLMPALFATAKATDIETGIVMSDETKKDEVNFWIKDGKTAEYEYNADYPKTPNSSNFNIYGVHDHGDLSWIAISPEIAEGSMAIGYQVPAAGDYMLSLSETYVSDDIEHIFVTDHEASPEVTVDLVERDYIFHVNQAETNNTRFTVSIKLKDEDTGTTTGIDNLDVNSDVPTKFIYQDKMYILYKGVIYDATGKKVREIK